MIPTIRGSHVLETLTSGNSLLLNVVLLLLLISFNNQLAANAASLMPNSHDNYFENVVQEEPIDIESSYSASTSADDKLNRLQLIDIIGQLVLNSKLNENEEDTESVRPTFAKRSFEDIDKHLSEEDRKLIQEAISKNLINRLKNMFAVTTRSRYGKRSLSKRMLREQSMDM